MLQKFSTYVAGIHNYVDIMELTAKLCTDGKRKLFWQRQAKATS